MQEQIRQYREAIEEAIKSAFFGKMPDDWKILINEQTVQEPSFGWLDNFKQSLKTVSAPGNNPFSNRFRESSADPNILRRIPSMQVMSNPVVIALDTSGSISEEELGVFVGYFLNAIKENGPRKINYIFITCDADIHSVISIGNTPRKNYMITFHNGEEEKKYLSPNNIQLDNLMQLILEEGIRGGGGTSFVPVFEYLKKEFIKPAFVFYFTDCAGEYPEEPPEYEDNVYWMFYQKTKDATPYIRPPFGNLVYVSKDALIAANKEENYENEL
jgi:predicted metal-dependent peptidase